MQNNAQILVTITGKLLQDHAFDHLSDENISRLRESFNKLSQMNSSLKEHAKHQNDLLHFYTDADIYSDTSSQQSVHNWCRIMAMYGKSLEHHADSGILDE